MKYDDFITLIMNCVRTHNRQHGIGSLDTTAKLKTTPFNILDIKQFHSTVFFLSYTSRQDSTVIRLVLESKSYLGHVSLKLV